MPGSTPQVGDLLQIRVKCRAGVQISLNVLHYAIESVVGGGATIANLATQYELHVAPFYKTWMTAHTTFESVSVQNVTPPITDPSISALQAGIGTSGGNLTPKQASGLIKTFTGLGGRHNRGRVYVGFMSDASVDPNGELLAGAVVALANIATALGPTMTLTGGGATSTLRLTVRHPNLAGPPVLTSFTPVTGLTASGLIATQRRRGDFGRPNP